MPLKDSLKSILYKIVLFIFFQPITIFEQMCMGKQKKNTLTLIPNENKKRQQPYVDFRINYSYLLRKT